MNTETWKHLDVICRLRLVQCSRPSASQVARLEKKLASLSAPMEKAASCLETESKRMDKVKSEVRARRDVALDELRSYLHAPPATWHVLKALFRVLKRGNELGQSWRSALSVIDEGLFTELEHFDITTEHDGTSWKAVRSAYKGVGDQNVALKRWKYELPESCVGAFFMLFIRQVCMRSRNQLRGLLKHTLNGGVA
jgi:hypothetical protein